MTNLEDMIKIIEDKFYSGRIKQIDFKEMINYLEEKGFMSDDIDDALTEAEKRKIIEIRGGYCNWIDPKIRELEKSKTKKYYEIIADIFRHGQIDFLPEEDVEIALKERGFEDEEVLKILSEAERDFVLHFSTRSFGPKNNLVAGCSWIPPEERQSEEEAEKRHRKWLDKWHEKKAMQEEMWEE